MAGSPLARHHAAWSRPSQRHGAHKHACRATEDGQPQKGGDEDAAAAEARLEAYERGAKRRQGALQYMSYLRAALRVLAGAALRVLAGGLQARTQLCHLVLLFNSL